MRILILATASVIGLFAMVCNEDYIVAETFFPITSKYLNGVLPESNAIGIYARQSYIKPTQNTVINLEKPLLQWANLPSEIERHDYNAALNYCSTLVLDNYSDWRIPTKYELEVIFEQMPLPSSNVFVDKRVFPNTQPYWYWTSTIDNEHGVFLTDFSGTHVYTTLSDPIESWHGEYQNSYQSDKYVYTRCVRDRNEEFFTINELIDYTYNLGDQNTSTSNDASFVINNGWTLIGISQDILDMKIFDNVDLVWYYKNEQWYAYSADIDTRNLLTSSGYPLINEIAARQGFWVLSQVDNIINLSDYEDLTTNIEFFEDNNSIALSWSEAQTYCEDNFILARLPSKSEVENISSEVNHNRYWTTTEDSIQADMAYYYSFNLKLFRSDSKINKHFPLCIVSDDVLVNIINNDVSYNATEAIISINKTGTPAGLSYQVDDGNYIDSNDSTQLVIPLELNDYSEHKVAFYFTDENGTPISLRETISIQKPELLLSQQDAILFCEQQGKHLPSWDELSSFFIDNKVLNIVNNQLISWKPYYYFSTLNENDILWTNDTTDGTLNSSPATWGIIYSYKNGGSAANQTQSSKAIVRCLDNE